MTAPTDIPVNGDGTWRSPTWGEGGTYSTSAYEGNGAPQGTLIGPNDFNEPRRNVMRWVRAMRDRAVPSDQGLFGSFLFPGSGTWNVGGGTLNGTLGASWAVIDASDDGGVVIQYSVSAGSPHVFTANRQTFVALNESGLAEYNAVPLGDPAPSPSAGYVNVWNVSTNVSEISSATVLIPEVPVLKAIEVETLDVTGDASVDGTLEVTGATTLNGSTEIDDDLLVTGETIVQGLLNCNELEVDTTSQFTGDVTFSANVAANGNTTIGNASGDTLTCNATATFVNNVTVQGNTTLGDATTDTVTFTAKAASDLDMDGNAVREASRIVLQTGVSPTNAGHLTAGGSGVLRYQPAGTAHYVHTSEKGRLLAFEMDADQMSLNGATAELCRCSVSPNAVGDILLTCTFFFDPDQDAGRISVIIRDDTASSNLVTRTVRGKDYDGATDRGETVTIRYVYTLPDATAGREFVVVLQTLDGAGDVYNPVLSVHGVS